MACRGIDLRIASGVDGPFRPGRPKLRRGCGLILCAVHCIGNSRELVCIRLSICATGLGRVGCIRMPVPGPAGRPGRALRRHFSVMHERHAPHGPDPAGFRDQAAIVQWNRRRGPMLLTCLSSETSCRNINGRLIMSGTQFILVQEIPVEVHSSLEADARALPSLGLVPLREQGHASPAKCRPKRNFDTGFRTVGILLFLVG